jgi:hypothetical protein
MRDLVKPFEFPLYFVTAVLALYLAAGNILRGADWPSEGFWHPWSVAFVGLIITALYVPVYALYKALDAHYERLEKEEAEAANERATLDRDLQVVCQRVVSGIADGCPGVEINDLGAHVWLCQSDGSFDRRARFLLPEARKRSGVSWGRGKGVAGMAWEEEKDLLADLRPVHETLRRLSREEFDALPARERHGLTASELESTLAYTGVCAIRLFAKDAFVGLFLIDYTGQDQFNCVAEMSAKRPVSTAIAACEERLAEVLSPL